MINDVSGGKIDERILLIALQYQVPIVLMHMRGSLTPPFSPCSPSHHFLAGTPTTMQDKENLKYPQGEETVNTCAYLITYLCTGKLLDEVATFLKGRAEIAQRVGIPRWHIILDPGTNAIILLFLTN